MLDTEFKHLLKEIDKLIFQYKVKVDALQRMQTNIKQYIIQDKEENLSQSSIDSLVSFLQETELEEKAYAEFLCKLREIKEWLE